ncbi:uncharacterized protein [Arachis hypogaea]|uniref:uncharacterized protein n=1 Tax=Arachis hypogaea TaxID=3818 RepID=UPI000DEC947A|nr:uncharacterized protein LOC112717798 [Arachis hypogaea]
MYGVCIGKGIRFCTKVTSTKLEELKKLDSESTLLHESKKAKSIPLPPLSNASELDSRKRRATGPLEKAFNVNGRETLDLHIAIIFFSSGLPFHLAKNPYFVKAFFYATNNYIDGYIPPGYNKLRTTLLEKEKQHVERMLEPTKNSWSGKGVSIVSDGWSDLQRRPLLNFMAVTESGPMFLKVVDCSDEIKDKDYVAKQIRDVIREVGLSNVVQIVTDNASICKAAGLLIETRFPFVYWTPCIVHTLNLALKDIRAAKNTEKNNFVYQKCSWITQIVEDASFIKNFIVSHHMRLSIFNEFNTLKLLNVATTRFASTIVMLKRFRLLKQGLKKMVISEKRSSYKEDNIGKVEFVTEKILSENWWQKIDYIIAFTNSIYDVLRSTDTDAPTLHLVHEMWDSMIKKVKSAIYLYERKDEQESSSFYNVVHSILVQRWTKSSTSLHCLAHSLNPRYYSHQWLREDPTRVSPHQDIQITNERVKCLKRYFPDEEERRKVNIKFTSFSGGRGVFDDYDSLNDRGIVNAKSWWLIHGGKAKFLQPIALRLLGQPSSSSCCERNWSTYSFIHSLKRIKLKPKRAENLVFVHTNLLSRKTSQYNKGETMMWNIVGDDFSPIDEENGVLEVAHLSLDEPELERVTFSNDEDINHI